MAYKGPLPARLEGWCRGSLLDTSCMRLQPLPTLWAGTRYRRQTQKGSQRNYVVRRRLHTTGWPNGALYCSCLVDTTSILLNISGTLKLFTIVELFIMTLDFTRHLFLFSCLEKWCHSAVPCQASYFTLQVCIQQEQEHPPRLYNGRSPEYFSKT